MGLRRLAWEIGCKHKATAPGRAEVRVRFRRGRLAFAISVDCEERAGERSAQVIARALDHLSPALHQLADECSLRVQDLDPTQWPNRATVVPVNFPGSERRLMPAAV